MGLLLGRDGKTRAMQAATGTAVGSIATLYIGFLQAAPADMDGMTLTTLVSAGQGNEFTINANFYTGRKSITLGSITTDQAGAVIHSSGADVTWTNTTGSSVEIRAMFITDQASGTAGNVLWVGTPDVGSAFVANGQTATISANTLELRID